MNSNKKAILATTCVGAALALVGLMPQIASAQGNGWYSRINLTPGWPQIVANKTATFSGLLEGLKPGENRYRGFSGEVVLTIRDRSNNVLLQQKQLSANSGEFNFRVNMSGVRGDLRKMTLRFPGNSQFRATEINYTSSLR